MEGNGGTRKSANYYVILENGQVIDFESKKLLDGFLETLDKQEDLKHIIRGFDIPFEVKTVIHAG